MRRGRRRSPRGGARRRSHGSPSGEPRPPRTRLGPGRSPGRRRRRSRPPPRTPESGHGSPSPWPLAVSREPVGVLVAAPDQNLVLTGPAVDLVDLTAADVDAVVTAAAADHVRALGALDLLAVGAADDALAVALRAQVDVLLDAHAQRL